LLDAWGYGDNAMLISKMIEKLQTILKEHGDFPVGIRAEYNHKLLMAYLWDEDEVITMRLQGKLEEKPDVSY
jgi:hypothetical protein